MRPVPQVRTQNAYNCGSYSLWMALESLTGQDDALIKKIEDKAVRNSDSMGGIFNYVQMERIIEALGYSCRRVKFHDVDSMNDALDNHTNDAIIIAYCYDMLFGGGLNLFGDQLDKKEITTTLNFIVNKDKFTQAK